MLKFHGVAKVGDCIRAYDFKPCRGREDAYIEGVVESANNTEMGFRAYKITVTADKFAGEIETTPFEGNRVGKIFWVPQQVDFMEYDFRIVNLSSF